MRFLVVAAAVAMAMSILPARADNIDDCDNWSKLVWTEGARVVAACDALATKGEAKAQFILGNIYSYGWGVRQDYAIALDWYQKSADQGFAAAQEQLAELYYQGAGVKQAYDKAAELFLKAGEQANPWAQYFLGLMYRKGQSFQQDYNEALNWYRKAAEQNNIFAQNDLADMYYNGEGIRQNYAEAAKWYRKSADLGNVYAQYSLGFQYGKGQGVQKSYGEAAKWWRKAADQGNAGAQFDLGVLYANGQGVKKNYAEAIKWYLKAAEQGDKTAQFNLGLLYDNGLGVPKSHADAEKWYRKGAEQGEANCQNNLGVLYQYGQGVPKDYVQAYMWYNLAATGGNDKASKNRDIVERQMTPDQIAEAQKRTSEWRPKGPEVARYTFTPDPATPPAVQASGEVFGTGFFITHDGEALTNAHVVEGCSLLRIRLAGQYVSTHIVARDSQNDLALIKADVQPTEIAHFRLSVRQGEDVEVFGFPLVDLLSSTGNATSGNVTALSGLGDDTRFLQISAPVQPGNSGGPLLDVSGNVIGVVVGKLDALKIASITSDIPQNVNFAIKSAVVASFLDSNSVAYASGEIGNHLSAADIAERAKAFTVQIECQK